jgi:hypothetical protein
LPRVPHRPRSSLRPPCNGAILDPSSDPLDNTLTKVGVDATKPSGADFAERLRIAEEQRARVHSILSTFGYGFSRTSSRRLGTAQTLASGSSYYLRVSLADPTAQDRYLVRQSTR